MKASITFSLNPVPPFRLDLTVWALRRRPNNVIDRWDGETYRRALVVNGHPAEVAVKQSGSPDSPRIRVNLTGRRIASEVKALARTSLERLLGLRIDLAGYGERSYRICSRVVTMNIAKQSGHGSTECSCDGHISVDVLNPTGSLADFFHNAYIRELKFD